MSEEAPEIDVTEAARRFRAGEAILLDVREPSELKRAAIEGVLHIPMRQVPQRIGELPQDKPILVLCHHGGRSEVVANWLRANSVDAANVAGGIAAWAALVDESVGRY